MQRISRRQSVTRRCSIVESSKDTRSWPRSMVERSPRIPARDLDVTDDPLHGHQEGRFLHGYCDCYCYVPFYVFCARHQLAAKLRRSNTDASAGVGGSRPPRCRHPRPLAAGALTIGAPVRTRDRKANSNSQGCATRGGGQVLPQTPRVAKSAPGGINSPADHPPEAISTPAQIPR